MNPSGKGPEDEKLDWGEPREKRQVKMRSHQCKKANTRGGVVRETKGEMRRLPGVTVISKSQYPYAKILFQRWPKYLSQVKES